MYHENLSSSDRRLYQRTAYRQSLSQAMLNESLSVKENVAKVDDKIDSQIPHPFPLFLMEKARFYKEEWRNYAGQICKGPEKYRTTL